METVLAETYLAKFAEVISYKSQFFHINQTENEALFSPEPKVWNDLFAKGIGSALYILSDSSSSLERQSLSDDTWN